LRLEGWFKLSHTILERERLLRRAVLSDRRELPQMSKRIFAYIFLIAGVAGLALPILPGVPLLLVGLKLLGPKHPIRETVTRWMTTRRGNQE
jgi:uncharacterized RDD family membrane protein YckC